MTLEIGQLIEGKYRIVRLLGEGGMGAVYEGENVRINRRVAIKVLHSAFTGNAEVIQRFEREAQAAGRIGNDHILEVIDLGSLSDGDHFIVMEFLDGEPLSARIKNKGRLTPHELTPIIRQVLVGLGAAHVAGIVHRDLKPDNIYVLREKAGQRDFVKIIDFGISKFQPLSGDVMKMTRTGAVMGTPYYMSPEQASGSHEADQRSDLYSIGVIMFEAITGAVPFDAATFNQLMFKIVLAEVPTLTSVLPDSDPAYSSIVAKAMARDVGSRFQSATEFISALDEWTTRGTAVSVPHPVNAADAGLVPNARAGSSANIERPVGPGARTAGNWATSQHDAELAGIPKKKSGAVVALLAGLGVVVLAGGGFVAYRALGAPAAESESSSLAHAAPSALPATEPKPVPAKPAAPEIAVAPVAAPPPPSVAAPVSSANAPPSKPVQASAPAKPPAGARPPSVAAQQVTAGKGKTPNNSRPAPAKPNSSPDFGY